MIANPARRTNEKGIVQQTQRYLDAHKMANKRSLGGIQPLMIDTGIRNVNMKCNFTNETFKKKTYVRTE